MRQMLRAVALFNVATALWLSVMFLILRHPGFGQNAMITLAIAAFCGFAFYATQSSAAPWMRWMRAASLLGNVLLGACGAWAIYQNLQPSARFEGFILIIGAMWIVQGLTSLIYASAGAAPAVGPSA